MKNSEALARLRGGKVKQPKDKLSAVAVLINAEHRAVVHSMKDGMAHALKCGDLLLKAKDAITHGDWLPWLKKHCDFAESTARAYMQVARNRQRVGDLSFREALKVLASKEENVHFSSESIEWYTPVEVIQRVVASLGEIELDPCANEDNQVQATKHFTAADDGLAREWFGRVYMNPPYGSDIGLWVQRLCEQYACGNVTEAIALVPARVDTEWFRMFRDFAVCFVNGRLKFSGCDNSAPFPSALVYLGKNIDGFCAAFEGVGDVWTRRRG